jgi:predicted lipid-binding transport protein (Tim44 family)
MTPRRRRLAIVFAAAGVLALVAPAVAMAGAGGGTGGFSPSGGGGGGGGGGGRAFEIYIVFRILFEIALLGHGLGFLFILAAALAFYIYRYEPKFWAAYQARRQEGRARRAATKKRERKTELAAAEAADDDPIFSPDAIRTSAEALFNQIQAAWDTADRIRLRGLVAPRLLEEWERRLDEFDRNGWRNHVEPTEPPHVSLVGLNNRDPQDARAVVKIEAKMKDYVIDRQGNHLKRTGRFTETARLREFWTLQRRDDHWILESVEQGSEGSHQLEDQLVPTAWADNQQLHDEALVEQANADALSADKDIADYGSFGLSSDAQAQANDLSLVDGRFAPDILAVAARRAVAAWSRAVDGSDAELHTLATPQAISDLLNPDGPDSRIVVRGVKVESITVTALDPHSTPPTMTIDVRISGRRYLQDRNTAAILSGSDTKTSTFTERWTLAFSYTNAVNPWHIIAAETAAAGRT